VYCFLVWISTTESANQTYNAELGTTAVVRCGITVPDYPEWSFTFPNGTQLLATSNMDFNPLLPSFGRMYWVGNKHLEIRSVTKKDQGLYVCMWTGSGVWTVQFQPIGMQLLL